LALPAVLAGLFALAACAPEADPFNVGDRAALSAGTP